MCTTMNVKYNIQQKWLLDVGGFVKKKKPTLNNWQNTNMYMLAKCVNTAAITMNLEVNFFIISKRRSHRSHLLVSG